MLDVVNIFLYPGKPGCPLAAFIDIINHRCGNNVIDTVDVNANSAVDVFGTHT